MLAQLGVASDDSALNRGLGFLRQCQEKDGSWFGRWGMNYIYGTWSVLCALAAAGVDRDASEIRSAVAWLRSMQNEDGGWGEGGDSYSLDYRGHQRAPSTPSQTAWALLGLMAAGEARSTPVARGVEYLLAHQGATVSGRNRNSPATGFPRVFYLRYHGYAKFFPLWALARYRNFTDSGDTASASACDRHGGNATRDRRGIGARQRSADRRGSRRARDRRSGRSETTRTSDRA
jgi:squalene-hopene/tetraprenyl-beta-curcumene cyclase